MVKYTINNEKLDSYGRTYSKLTIGAFLEDYLNDGLIYAGNAIEALQQKFFSYYSITYEELSNDEVLHYSYISERDQINLSDEILREMSAYIIYFDEIDTYILCETANRQSTLYSVEEGSLKII